MKKDARKIGIWGGTGSGKSTRVKELTKDCNRMIVIDPIGDYGQERGFKNFTTLKSLYAALKRDWNKGFRFVLTVGRADQPDAVLEQLANGLFIIQTPYKEGRNSREITLVVEEMSLCYPERTLGRSERNFQQLVNLGRHYGIEIIGASQRMAEVKKNFVSNCSEHYFFRMGAAVDYDAACRIIGRERRAELQALQTHYYLNFVQGVTTQGKNLCNFKLVQK